MSSLKKYAKEAKERMRNGFWQEIKLRLEEERNVAATRGMDSVRVTEEQRRKLIRRLYDEKAYRVEESFYEQVAEILESEETVLDPLSRLADQNLLKKLNESEKQAYFLKLSSKFQKAVEKYNAEKGKKSG